MSAFKGFGASQSCRRTVGLQCLIGHRQFEAEVVVTKVTIEWAVAEHQISGFIRAKLAEGLAAAEPIEPLPCPTVTAVIVVVRWLAVRLIPRTTKKKKKKNIDNLNS